MIARVPFALLAVVALTPSAQAAEKVDVRGVEIGMTMDEAVKAAESNGGVCARTVNKGNCNYKGTSFVCENNKANCSFSDSSRLEIFGTSIILPSRVKTFQYHFTLGRTADLQAVLKNTFGGYMVGQCNSESTTSNGKITPNCYLFPDDLSGAAAENQAMSIQLRNSAAPPKF